MAELVDTFGRVHTAMRVSVTDRCNLRCHYCMPEEGMEYVSRSEVLSYEELTRIVKVAASLGVTKVRLTGGEPLLRADLSEFVAMIRDETEVEDIALTTNGLLLARHAEALVDAGLDRINVSCDSLDPRRFERITRWGLLEDVWAGIERAADVGLGPIKVNALILDGFNDDEFERWIELVKGRKLTVRFMELMPMGDNALDAIGGYLDLTKVRERLQRDYDLEPAVDAHRGNGPARYWTHPSWEGSLGFITPISNSYCGQCSRLRLTCLGELRACLAYEDHIKLKEAARRGDDAAIAAGFKWAVSQKRAGHPWHEGVRTETGMSALGG